MKNAPNKSLEDGRNHMLSSRKVAFIGAISPSLNSHVISLSGMQYTLLILPIVKSKNVVGASCSIIVSSFLCLFLLAFRSLSDANSAAPWRDGDLIGEPTGDLQFVAIEHETLTIDLRPLADRNSAIVDAIYLINNIGAQRTINLIFVATAMTSEPSQIWLDENSVPSIREEQSDLPSTWRPPQTTPGIDGSDLSYHTRANGNLKFTITLAPGRHTLRVRHRAMPTENSGNSTTVYWQLGYVLSPARQWASFSKLETIVYLPAGWRAATVPSLEREQDTLVGTWNNLPADNLALTVQAPPKSSYKYLLLTVTISGLILICGYLGWRLGRWFKRHWIRWVLVLPLLLIITILWVVAIMYAAKIDHLLAGNQATWGDTNEAIFILFFGVPAGIIITLICAYTSFYEARSKGAI